MIVGTEVDQQEKHATIIVIIKKKKSLNALQFHLICLFSQF